MRSRKMIGAVICLVALVGAGLLPAQPPQGQGRRGPRRGGFDPARMRQMMAERMKERLQIGDQEWKVIEPRLTKVLTLSRDASGPGRMGMFFGPGRREPGTGRPGGDRPDRPERELTPVQKAGENLRTTLENESTTPEQIKKALTDLRAAREKAKQELAVAQKQLQQLLTMRQEAGLVLMGLLN